jgi:hypothetical protein
MSTVSHSGAATRMHGMLRICGDRAIPSWIGLQVKPSETSAMINPMVLATE